MLLSDFQSDVEHQPEAVARHLSGAGHHAEASDYWLAAGQSALTRMAIPEAHGHFARALDGLKRLPESPEILTKELDLQIAIAPTLMTVHGWASPTVADACERARALCQQLDRPDKLYPPVWGLWTNLFVGGLLDRALVTANEALAMALASGVPMLEVTGRHAVAYTHYYRGEWAEAIPHAEAGARALLGGAGARPHLDVPAELDREPRGGARQQPLDDGPPGSRAPGDSTA